MNVLVLNCGSSSIKYQLLNMDAVPVVLAKGIVEKIGLTYGSFTYKPEGKDKVVAEQPIMDHSVGMDLILKALVHPDHGVLKSLNEIDAVGHRVAHGGEYFSSAQSGKPERDRNDGKIASFRTSGGRFRYFFPSDSA